MRQVIIGTVLGLAALVGLGPTPTRADLISYTDRAAFHATAADLALQTFDAAELPGSFARFSGPLNAQTDHPFFSPGDILPGLEIDTGSGRPNNLLITNTGFGGLANKAISARTGGDPLVMNFEPNVLAVGLGLVNASDAGTLFTIDVYTVGDLLGSFAATAATEGEGIFFGVTSFGGVSISSIVITVVSEGGEEVSDTAGIDFVEFGPLQAVPEPASLVMAGGGGIGLLAIGWVRRRQQRRPNA